MTLMIYVSHVRAVRDDNYCVPGMKTFFQQHNLDFKKFVREGITEEELLKTGDAMAFLVIEEARKEWAANQIVKQ